MDAKVNKVTIRLSHVDLLSIAAAGLVIVTDTNLKLPPALLQLTGQEVLQETEQVGWSEVGSAVVTRAGHLPYSKLIHAVAPRWGEGSERGKLMNLTRNCLHLAEVHQLRSIAMPALSTGTLGYPIENCAYTMLSVIVDFTFDRPRYVREIIIALETEPTYEVFKTELERRLDILQQDGEGNVVV
jgi:O-acetyl-ADP-ribose deacetylase (regulator of RNase III)